MSDLILKISLRLIIYSLSIYLLLSLYFLYIYIHPQKFISTSVPQDLGLAYQDITFETEDGIKLAAWFIPQWKSNQAIIICHGYPADKGDVLGLASFLAPHYNLLLFDFRGLGKSKGRFSTGGWREREDFLAAVRFLKAKGFSDIGAFGFSMGAAVILMSNSPEIKAIVSDSSYADLNSVLNLIFQNFGIFRKAFVGMMKFWARIFFRMDVDKTSALKYISSISCPIFLIHSELDSQIPVEHALLLHKRNPKSQIWIISGAEHGEAQALRPQEYQDKILNFFQSHL